MNQISKNIITVFVVLHNTSSKNLDECLNSLYNQTLKYFNVFIINNDSDNDIILDNLNVINKYKKILDITYFTTDNFIHNYAAIFAFLDKVKTKYVCICNPDSIQSNKRLENQYLILSQNKYDMIYSNITNVDNHEYHNNESGIINMNNILLYNIFTFDSLMFRKNSIINFVSIHSFESLYNDIHALIFNYSILNINPNIKIYYDNTVETIFNNSEYKNFNLLEDYKKLGIHKLYNNQIYYNDNTHLLINNSQITFIMLFNSDVDDNYEMYKTLFNIRFMSNNIKIIISAYNTTSNELPSYYYSFNINYIYTENDSFGEAFNNAICACDTDYVIISPKPLRFYNNFDNNILTNIDDVIIQPNIVDFDSFYFWQFEQDNNERTGNKFLYMNEKVIEKYDNQDNQDLNNYLVTIPILDDDFIFIAKTSVIANLYALYGLQYKELSNVFLSIKSCLNDNPIVIDKNIKCKVINSSHKKIVMDEEDQSIIENEYKLKYTYNLLCIAYLLFNDSFYVYAKIANNIINDENTIDDLIEEIVSNEQLNEIRKQLQFKNNINYFFYNMYNFDK